MRVLVTGGTGFVGGHLIDVLLAQGLHVTALVRSTEKARSLAERGVVLVVGDLLDLPALDRAAARQDLVFHVAGLVAARSEAELLEVNREGTRRLVQAAEAAGVPRLLFVSSLAAGGPALDTPLRGPEPSNPVTGYGRSKLAGEDVVRESGLAWTIVRPPVVYGPGDKEMLRVFKAAALGFAPVFGDGSQRLSLVYGPDLAAALVSAGQSDATRGRVYYPAHPEIVTSRSLVETVGRAAGRRVRIVGLPEFVGRAALRVTDTTARLLGRATVLNYDKANEFFQPAWTCDPTALTDATGWAATHDLARGAEETLAWYRARGWL
jgi:nucleoside-diphosphate-sugar epimerase